VAVLREQGRRRLRRLLAVVGVVATAGILAGAVYSPLLAVDHVDVHGIGGPHAAEVRAVLRSEIGEPLLLVDTHAAAVKVETLEWVDHARVDRALPGTLRVEVTPRFPVAWRTDSKGRVLLVDRVGGVISIAPAPPAGLPRIEASGADARASARVAAALSATLRARVSAVYVQRGEAFFLVAPGIQARLGEVRVLRAKVSAVEALLPVLGGAPPTYIDVRVPSAPVTG
jgi:cell division protein FtsQ